ncbi:MAG: transposase [Anaerolineaceae bacterium]|nr:transposase [Anaerolineaceae bacterium]
MEKPVNWSKLRRQIPRLNGWDYSSPGQYFITICTHKHKEWFGSVRDAVMCLNPLGKIAFDHWYAICDHFNGVGIEPFAILPNHIHAIITLTHETHEYGVLLGTVIGNYKSAVSRSIRRYQPEFQWQPRYYDHLIRNEHEYDQIAFYIVYNAAKWKEDQYAH